MLFMILLLIAVVGTYLFLGYRWLVHSQAFQKWGRTEWLKFVAVYALIGILLYPLYFGLLMFGALLSDMFFGTGFLRQALS